MTDILKLLATDPVIWLLGICILVCAAPFVLWPVFFGESIHKLFDE